MCDELKKNLSGKKENTKLKKETKKKENTPKLQGPRQGYSTIVYKNVYLA